MKKQGIFPFVIIFFCTLTAFGQTKKEKKEDNSFAPVPQEQSATQKKIMKKKGKKSSRAAFNKRMDKKIKEFDQRMEANAKENKKMRREMEKPQYSDPSYFGHKKKPKKRKQGKRKLCKECGIWH
ncbi:hypothetical protein [Fulvivirga lutimaris]|uniref:hypothetical protein n=1 Tax=Fulvivirga lutimaris TaxID=1819566 RepID=UPI0012BBE91E|nr:hypothetical protein [Fulvivirga lutimaris]MTI41274.1 hypothetical protein [Fulvivirga lutimaris]